MSFRCDSCQKPQTRWVKPVFVVTRIRQVIYDCGGKNLENQLIFPEGWEIAHEARLCQHCAQSQKAQQPQVVGDKKKVKTPPPVRTEDYHHRHHD